MVPAAVFITTTTGFIQQTTILCVRKFIKKHLLTVYNRIKLLKTGWLAAKTAVFLQPVPTNLCNSNMLQWYSETR